MDNKSYLVTGGFGLIGSNIVNNLTGKVTVLSHSENNKERIKNKQVKTLIKDLKDVQPSDLSGIDVIYHCASTVDNYHVLDNPYVDVDTNIKGTISLLEACKDLPKKPKVIYLSTFFVYGNVYEETQKPIDEESKTDPLALYPATKLCTENVIKLYSKLYNIPYILTRLTNVYGEEENFTNKRKGAFNYLVMQAVKGEPINLYNNGDFFRDYIYVDDVVSALLFLENKVENDLFLIGFGEKLQFKAMIDYLLDKTGNKSDVVPYEPPDFHKIVGITNFVANTEKINSLGWRASINYKQGIDRIITKYSSVR